MTLPTHSASPGVEGHLMNIPFPPFSDSPDSQDGEGSCLRLNSKLLYSYLLKMGGQVWWHMPAIPALRRMPSGVSLGYIARPSVSKIKHNTFFFKKKIVKLRGKNDRWQMEEDSLPSYGTSVSGVGRSGKSLITWPAHLPP